MAIQRNWVTPLAAGAFLLSAVTGALMFFHFDTGLNKLAHEWLSWALLGAVALHVTANFDGFKRHLGARRGQLLVGTFALVLLFSFVGTGEKDEPPFAPPIRALAAAPLTTLAQLAHITPEQLRERLAQAGVKPTSDQQTLGELVGPDMRKQVHVLGTMFGAANH